MATTVTTVKKSLIGVEDLAMDVAGGGATYNRNRSDGTVVDVRRINASHLPITATTRAKKGADNVTVAETNVDALLQAILDELVQIGIPDGTTVEFSGGTLQIKAGGVGTTQLDADAVDDTKLADNAVGTEHLQDKAVTSVELANDASTDSARAVGSNHIKDDAIIARHIGAGEIGNDAVGDATIKAAKLADTPAFYIAEAGSFSSSATTTDTFAHTVSETGLVAGTDIVHIQMRSAGTGPVAVKESKISGGTEITAVTDANQTGGTTIFDYVIYRPVSV